MEKHGGVARLYGKERGNWGIRDPKGSHGARGGKAKRSGGDHAIIARVAHDSAGDCKYVRITVCVGHIRVVLLPLISKASLPLACRKRNNGHRITDEICATDRLESDDRVYRVGAPNIGGGFIKRGRHNQITNRAEETPERASLAESKAQRSWRGCHGIGTDHIEIARRERINPERAGEQRNRIPFHDHLVIDIGCKVCWKYLAESCVCSRDSQPPR